MKIAIFITSCGLLFFVPMLFVMNKVYKDGIIGRAALLIISFMSATVLMDYFNGVEYELLPQTVGLVAAFAVFMSWHFWKFHRRVLRQFRQCNESLADRRFHPE